MIRRRSGKNLGGGDVVWPLLPIGPLPLPLPCLIGQGFGGAGSADWFRPKFPAGFSLRVCWLDKFGPFGGMFISRGIFGPVLPAGAIFLCPALRLMGPILPCLFPCSFAGAGFWPILAHFGKNRLGQSDQKQHKQPVLSLEGTKVLGLSGLWSVWDLNFGRIPAENRGLKILPGIL
jgi:hypothetical protein